MVMEAVKALSAEEITELCLRHTLYDWSAQAGLKPLPVARAKGVYFHTADGRRFIDFNSQLMFGNAVQATGDPRRWANENPGGGVVHVLDPYHGIQRGWDAVEEALADLDETIQLEGPQTIAAFMLEPIVGTNGILIPPDGYLQGV